ncbi:PE family protein [Mycobacterium bourgelatii]|uniref:PE family protein n=1 Tax=Mycobacterium bourgelatii TaxID=1273442 RepID=A0A7I9YZI9_MYCBU|nr:PE-PPE domain-containing protein [Mycobacterium bourgelatii]MCV6976579.1 PE-PPE domain-containing protein [Mycobacterium bourgelatii]GFG94028.1 PE family protein [Mycobacterium bourgelatii]
MSFLIAEPQALAGVATNIEGIGSALATANSAAASEISGIASAAADEVSTAIAEAFGRYGQEFQSAFAQVHAYHTQFQQSLTSAANAYASAEANIATSLQQLLGLTSYTPPNLQPGVVPPFPANDVSIFIGGTGVPIPSQSFVTKANNLYVRSAMTLQSLVTPEQLYPITGVRSMPLDTSVQEGITILENTLYDQIVTQGNSVTVFGISQSAIISSLLMRNIAAGTSIFGATPPDPSMLNFVLTGNEMNPNGGMLSRFPGLSLASLGLTFYGATPADTIYPVANYTLEYDGFADFPRYPINLLADLNAIMGIVYVHTTYLDLTPAQIDGALQLPTSPGYTGNTTYYVIRTENLPLLEPLRAVPVIGNPLANLFQPTAKVLVNLGYGDPNYGFSTSYADVPTPFGFLPDIPPQVIGDALVAAGQQGVADFTRDMQALASQPVTLPTFALPSQTGFANTAVQLPTPEKIVNTAASIISTDYGVLLPTADILLSLVTTLPLYNTQLFLTQLAAGNLVNAFAYPLVADLGLASIAGGVEFLVLVEALANNVQDLQALFA